MKAKKLLITLIALLTFSFNGFALDPECFSYLVYDEENELITNTPLGIRISYMQEDSTSVVYSTDLSVTTDNNGVAIFCFDADYRNIDDVMLFHEIEYVKNGYLKIEIDLTNGTVIDPTGAPSFGISGVLEYTIGEWGYLEQERIKELKAFEAFVDSVKNDGIVVARALFADTAQFALETNYANNAGSAEESDIAENAKYADTAKYVENIGSVALVPVKLTIVDEAGVSPTVTLAGNVYTASSTENLILPSFCPTYMSVSIPDDKLSVFDHFTITINGEEFSSYDGLYYTDVQSVDFDEQKVYYDIVQIYLNRNKSLSNFLVGPFTKTDGTVNEIKITFLKKIA